MNGDRALDDTKYVLTFQEMGFGEYRMVLHEAGILICSTLRDWSAGQC